MIGNDTKLQKTIGNQGEMDKANVRKFSPAGEDSYKERVASPGLEPGSRV